jgi:hypothetical protein
MLKVVAVPPLIGERRWRALGLAAFAFVATALLAPALWASFFHQAGAVAGSIHAESGGGASAWGEPLLFIPAVVALCLLALVDLRAGELAGRPGSLPDDPALLRHVRPPGGPVHGRGHGLSVAGRPGASDNRMRDRPPGSRDAPAVSQEASALAPGPGPGLAGQCGGPARCRRSRRVDLAVALPSISVIRKDARRPVLSSRPWPIRPRISGPRRQDHSRSRLRPPSSGSASCSRGG